MGRRYAAGGGAACRFAGGLLKVDSWTGGLILILILIVSRKKTPGVSAGVLKRSPVRDAVYSRPDGGSVGSLDYAAVLSAAASAATASAAWILRAWRRTMVLRE